jgi:hypothetical protein
MLMTLTNREKMTIVITNTIALYSQKLRDGTLPANQSVVDFILKTIPDVSRSELSIELIDDVFSFISNSHMQLS